jgi:hypothetical protein
MAHNQDDDAPQADSALLQAALRVVLNKPEFKGKFPAAGELLIEPANPDPDLRVIVRVVLFDTEAAAAEYAHPQEPKQVEDKGPAGRAAP